MFQRKLALKFCSFQKKFFLKIMENVDILKKMSKVKQICVKLKSVIFLTAKVKEQY